MTKVALPEHDWVLTSTSFPTTHRCRRCGAKREVMTLRDRYAYSDGTKMRDKAKCVAPGVQRLSSPEISALAMLAMSEGLRADVREKTLSRLDGEAGKIGFALVHGEGPDIEPHHLDAARSLKSWAKKMEQKS